MAQILELLHVNETFFFQIGIFLTSILVLWFLVFNPYLKAYEEREKATVGSKTQGQSLAEETLKLNNEFEQEARKQSLKLKDFFEKSKKESSSYSEARLSETKKSSESYLDTERKKIQSAISETKKQLSIEIPKIADEFKNKIIN